MQDLVFSLQTLASFPHGQLGTPETILRQYFLSEAFPDSEFLFSTLCFLYVYTSIIAYIT